MRIFMMILCCIPFLSIGQRDTINQYGPKGHKQGYWIVTGKYKPDKGYCDTCRIEEGFFIDSRKEGLWKKYYLNGGIRLEGTYVNNRPNGPYKKFYQSGCVMEIGDFSTQSRSSFERFKDDCNLIKSSFGSKDILSSKFEEPKDKEISNLAKKDTIKYFHSDSTLAYKAFFLNDVFTAYRYYRCGDLRSIIEYDSLGNVTSTQEVEASKGCFKLNGEKSDKERLWGGNGNLKNGKSFNPEGYNKIYNKEDELWLDGNFSEGYLWEGKHYQYDSDGILEKIEVWKNGSYHSDAAL